MKTFIMIIFVMGMAFWVTACSDNNEQLSKSNYGDLKGSYNINQTSVRVYTEKDLYSHQTDEIVLKVENKGKTIFNLGEERYLEKLVDGNWYRIPYKDLGFNSVNLTIAPGDSLSQEIPLEFLDYQLTEGIYRIPKAFNNDSEQFIIAAEFEIKN